MTNQRGRLIAVLTGLLMGWGCASVSRADGVTSRPTPPVGGAGRERESKPAPRDSLETVIGKVRELSVRVRPVRKDVAAATIESVDTRLRAALLALQAWPSGAAHHRVAEEYRRLRILDAAYDHYQAALRIDPRDAAGYDGLARIWRDWRLPALALGDARRAVYYAPESPEVYNTLGTVLHALGRREEAKQAYRRSLRLNPRAAYALNNLGYVRLVEGSRAAVDLFRLALASDPGLLAARHNLALAYAALGHPELARRELRQADPPAIADYNFGIVSLARRDRAAAAAAFDAACRARAGVRWACERFEQLRAESAVPGGTP